MTESEARERKGGGIRKGPRAGIQTHDARITTALYVSELPTRLSVPTMFF